MKILNSFSELPTPLALSIGNFDGVHLGHQAVISRLKHRAPHTAILTFSNPPSETLYQLPISRVCSLSHRLALLEEWGIETLFLFPFTIPFAQQTASQFLITLKRSLPFDYLILGHDAIIGSDRNRNLQGLANDLSFTLEYLDPITVNGTIVSSSAIRNHILKGDFQAASTLLGRPYSIRATVQPGLGIGQKLGVHTANLPVEDLTLPPFGVYAVIVMTSEGSFPGVANLGYAPTLHEKRPPCLEVHLIKENRDLYGQTLDVRFIHYLRPEKKFTSLSELKQQIKLDIALALEYIPL